MDKLREIRLGTEVQIFDPCDTATGSEEVADASVVKRNEQWWMYLAGQASGHGATDIYSASLLSGSPLSATGWKLTRSATGHLTPLAARRVSSVWDGKGGRHCPSYVKGWDRQKSEWVDQPEPAFTASEAWEHGSVYEPNLIYHEGKWKIKNDPGPFPFAFTLGCLETELPLGPSVDA